MPDGSITRERDRDGLITALERVDAEGWDGCAGRELLLKPGSGRGQGDGGPGQVHRAVGGDLDGPWRDGRRRRGRGRRRWRICSRRSADRQSALSTAPRGSAVGTCTGAAAAVHPAGRVPAVPTPA